MKINTTSTLLLSFVFISVCFNVLEIECAQGRKLPKYFPNCRRTDPKINECLMKATEQVKPYLAKGVPELGIPRFEPFNIPEITLEQGTRALNFKAKLTNVVAYGLTSYKFSRFDFDVPNLQFFCDAIVPGLRLEGDYTVHGQVLIAPIEGSGKFKAKIDSCNATVYQKIKIIKVKGLDHATPVLTNSTIKVSGPRAQLEGLFGGNKELNDATNKAINDNVDELFEELRPVVEKVLTSIMEDLLLKALMKNIPWDNLYPV